MDGNLHYKKITFENRKELTSDLIKRLHEINLVDTYPLRMYNPHIKRCINQGDYHFYLAFIDKELVGAAYGQFKDKITFSLDRLVVDSKFSKKGIGTKILGHVCGDLRAKHNIKEISMIPWKGTKIINRKLTGNKPLKCKISNLLYVFKKRTFNSNFRYDLEKKRSIGPNSTKHIIHVRRK